MRLAAGAAAGVTEAKIAATVVGFPWGPACALAAGAGMAAAGAAATAGDAESERGGGMPAAPAVAAVAEVGGVVKPELPLELLLAATAPPREKA